MSLMKFSEVRATSTYVS